MRAWAVLLGILGLLAQGTQVGHMLLVEHAVCAEHGELVHGEAHRATDSWADEAEAGQRATLRSSLGTEQAHAHEHCGTVNERRDAIVPALQAELRLARLDAALAQRFEPSSQSSSRARLRLAPKTSPPVS